MAVRDDLALIGWLAALAPESAQLAGAGPRATAALAAGYREAAELDLGLANCLRRCVATAAVHHLPPSEAGPVQRKVMADKARFLAALDLEEPALVAIAGLVEAFPGLAGRGFEVAPSVLEAFRVQARELTPREDEGGARAAIGVLEAILPGVGAAARLVVERELAWLHTRAGELGRAAELRGAEDGFSFLDAADHAAGRGDMDVATAQLSRAQRHFERTGSLPGMAAVRRRRAALLEPEERPPLLREAVRLSRGAADDLRGVVEGLEELSRAYSESGQLGPAVACLGEIAALQRLAADAAGEARALQLAGRLLCEAPSEAQEPGPGLVMLLWAADIGGTVDAVLADLTHRYVQGFQYTLTDAEWAKIEPLFEEDRDTVVNRTFARFREQFAQELP